MLRALMTAASGMKAQQLQLDTIANNIANVNTEGFKKSRLSFRSLLYQTIREPGGPTSSTQVQPTGLQIGSGAEVSSATKDFKQGELLQTDGKLDMAIQGEGFFRLRMPTGDFRYTRNGSFRLDANGVIVSTEGYPLEGAPSIPVDAISIVVGEDGTIATMNREDQLPQQLGQIQLYRFANPTGLKAQGRTMYSESGSTGAPQAQTPGQAGAGQILQGYTERSNVQTVDELVSLIVAQRNYEVNSRAIKASDEMLQQTNQLIR
ncbi:MAG: flagellar basal-body rod protein FlgG [Chlamydiales bacterium]|jgi:flagellar basal-body rod protein FlgG